MTWIKTNFMWMMYRCGWCTKDANQTRALALHLSYAGFMKILSLAVSSHDRATTKNDPVRLQWDPDHAPDGSSLTRRAVQLGLRGDELLHDFHHSFILKIEDVTQTLVAPQREAATNSNQWESLQVPVERVLVPEDPLICSRTRIATPSISTAAVDAPSDPL